MFSKSKWWKSLKNVMLRYVNPVFQLLVFFLMLCRLQFKLLYLPFAVLLMPVITLASCFIFSSLFSNATFIVSKIKYYPYFPFLFYYATPNDRFKYERLEELVDVVQPGDVILRRQNNYLVGLIFSQNSYFTHAGIICGEKAEKDMLVMHATAEEGVNHDTLNEFCDCDAFVVLRFKLDPSLVEKHFKQNTKVKSFEDELDEQELAAYHDYLHAVSRNAEGNLPGVSQFIKFMVDKAHSFDGRPFDLRFNFADAKKLCCIEFVWNCYSCLSPLHQLTTQTLRYFLRIKRSVIVPDMFISSDWFEVKFPSIDNLTEKSGKSQLPVYASSSISSLRDFIYRLLLCQFVIFILLCLYTRYHLAISTAFGAVK